MIDKIKTLCLSKTNIFAAAISSFAFLKDLQELITSFASHLKLVFISAIFLFGMLAINLIVSNKKQRKISNGINSIDDELKNNNILIGEDNLKEQKKSLIIPKIIFSTLLFLMLMTLGSLFYIKNMGVYYVVLQKELTIEKANALKKKTNSSEAFKNQGLSTRILNTSDGMTELVLFNGYISNDNANEDLDKINSMNLGFKPYTVGPQYVANYRKKIKYLQHNIFN
jgi:hypothetical protein